MRELPPSGAATPRDRDFAINQLIQGRSNAVTTVTLRPGFTTTIVNSDTININAGVFLFPRTANAASALATTYAQVTAAGVATITHANAATADRTFSMLIIGG